jgi:hypothetical protein
MNTYEITATQIINYTASIQAHDEADAWRIAEEARGENTFECVWVNSGGEFMIDELTESDED